MKKKEEVGLLGQGSLRGTFKEASLGLEGQEKEWSTVLNSE